MSQSSNKPKALILYYSFSGQTTGILHRLTAGLKQQKVQVVMEKIVPVKLIRFPVKSILAALKMMIVTLWRHRVEIKQLPDICFDHYDVIILAGPTWSYNPSAPLLALLDRDGANLFAGKQVIVLISCRGYWRLHWYGLRRILTKCKALIAGRIVFDHPCREPWSSIGVFLKIAGKAPERLPFISRYYHRYGHSKKQQEEAYDVGVQVGKALKSDRLIAGFNFHSLH